MNEQHVNECDEIDRIVDQALFSGTPFPIVCPCCGSTSCHVYMHKHKEYHGGIWAWCSECKSSAHMSAWIPIWWKNAPFIDEKRLCGSTDYLDSKSGEIDEWVNKLLKSEEAILMRKRLEEDKENVICVICGTEMIPLEKSSWGMICPNCNWGWVTTRFDPIDTDMTDYRIILQPGNAARIESIRIVSHLANVNYIQAKKLIEAAPVKVFEGKARDIVIAAAEMKAQNINHMIQPDFPYDID